MQAGESTPAAGAGRDLATITEEDDAPAADVALPADAHPEDAHERAPATEPEHAAPVLPAADRSTDDSRAPPAADEPAAARPVHGDAGVPPAPASDEPAAALRASDAREADNSKADATGDSVFATCFPPPGEDASLAAQSATAAVDPSSASEAQKSSAAPAGLINPATLENELEQLLDNDCCSTCWQLL